MDFLDPRRPDRPDPRLVDHARRQDHASSSRARPRSWSTTAEFGAALEALAGFLAEAGTPLPDDLRVDFDRLSTQVGNHDAVMERARRAARPRP